jgi:ubiquinone/menaquinone biosynthesis C-methylase UbiE
MLRDVMRASLRGVQYLGAKVANRRSHVNTSTAHDLLKARWMAAYIPDESSVLDIGCGNGRRLLDLSLFVRGIKSTGVELHAAIPPPALFPDAVIPELMVFDGEHLPFEDSSFDVCTICYVLHHLTDAHAEALLNEALRVTRGRLILLEDSRPSFSLAYRIRNWAHATEANLGYATESSYFKQNMQHSMFKTHSEWAALLSSLRGVEAVECVQLDPISVYKHHTMFIVDLRRAP